MGKRGAQKGNLTAVKHGFYSKTLTETEKLKLQEAEEIGGWTLSWPCSGLSFAVS